MYEKKKAVLGLILFLLPVVYSIERYSLSYTIPENTLVDTLIGTVSIDLVDRLKAGNQHVPIFLTKPSTVFKLGTHNKFFYLSTKNGKLIVKSPIDVDELCAKLLIKICQNDHASLELNVNLWTDEKLIAVTQVLVQVLDINDNKPHFSMTKIIKPVNEINHKAGRKIYLPQAIDADISEKYSKIFYGLSVINSDFELHIDKSGKPYLKLLHDFDAEKQDSYSFLLQAWNQDASRHKAHLSVTLEVEDFNDNEPTFNKSPFAVTIPENTPMNSKIFQLTATDPDKTAQITYSIDPNTNEDIQKYFQVKNDGGVWLKNYILDFETTPSYLIMVIVSDGIYSNNGELKIILQNINDEAPRFLLNPSRLKVVENNKPGLSIGQITVVDADDISVNGKIECSEPKSVASFQDLDFQRSSTKESENDVYEIKTKRSYDREEVSKGNTKEDVFLIARLVCVDGYGIGFGNHRLTSTLTLSVLVEDVNDNAPLFDLNLYQSLVPENSVSDMKCIQVNAHDKDKGENAAISFSLLENEDFKIDAISGWISARRMFDREEKAHYMINVVARDKGNPSLSSTALVNITIMDINDHSPELLHPVEFNLMENQRIIHPELLGTLNYEDKDEGNNAKVTFTQIWPYDDIFFLTSNGSLYYNSIFDREKQDRYCITVRLEDGGSDKQHQTTGTVCVKILDENDNIPVILSPKGMLPSDNIVGPTVTPCTPITMSVYESIGFLITTIKAKDNDDGENSKLSFFIEIPLGMPKFFNIGRNSGELTLWQSLSRGDIGLHRIRIKVQDNGIPSRYTAQVLVINVEDSPTLSEDNYKSGNILWIGGKNLMIVMILSSISVILIVVLISAILCMLRPCKETDIGSNPNQITYDRDHRFKKYVEEADQIGCNVDSTLLSHYGNTDMPQILLDNYIYTTHGGYVEDLCTDQQYQPWPLFQSQNDPRISLPSSCGINFNYYPTEINVSNNLQLLKMGNNGYEDKNILPLCSTLPKQTSSFGKTTSVYLGPNNSTKSLHPDEQQSDSGRGNSDDEIINLNNIPCGSTYQKGCNTLKSNFPKYSTIPHTSKVVKPQITLSNDCNMTLNSNPSTSTNESTTKKIESKNDNETVNDLGHLCEEINELFFKRMV